MKNQTIALIVAIFLVPLCLLSETITIDGVTIELPDSEVEQVLKNQDVTAKTAELKQRFYPGSEIGNDLKLLEKKLQTEGPTDENLSALSEIEKQIETVGKGDAAPQAPPAAPASPKQVAFNVAIQNGFDTGLGFKLALGDQDRNAFTQMFVMINTAKEKGLLQDDSPQAVADIDGELHTLTVAQLTDLLLAYGAHYKTLWATLKSKD
jgi:hypothetical protein